MTESTRRQFMQTTGIATGALAAAPLLLSTPAQAQG
ncbi:MAG: twin-arginine translocation signal domain-containing protein, partial [Rhodoferax sp.]|nr:twin-arginine translocation signal domain-containing protein [Rhodoferax sp.]